MHLPRLILFLLLLVTLPIFTEADEGSGSFPMAEVAGDPSGIVAGCVNAITGTYSDIDTDLVIPGPTPLIFQRVYCSSNWGGDTFCHSWDYNHGIEAAISEKNASYRYTISEGSGGAMQYYGGVVDRRRTMPVVPRYNMIGYQRIEHDKGLSNTGFGEISGRTNLKNQEASYDCIQKHLHAKLCDGRLRTYVPARPWEDPQILPVKFVLHTETLQSGNSLIYAYKDVPWPGERDKQRRVAVISLANDLEGAFFSSLRFDYSGCQRWNTSYTIKIGASDGRAAYFTFKDYSYGQKKRRIVQWYLTGVERPNGPKVNYDYTTHIAGYAQVTRKTVADRVVQEMEYYSGDAKQMGRLRVLKAPVGYDHLPIVTHRFTYFDNQTVVQDALNRRIDYHYNHEQRLTEIDYFTGQAPYALYSAERLFWNHTDLVCKALLHSDGTVRSCCVMDYDDKHNVINEHLMGNLSGTCTILPLQDASGIPQALGCECYTVQRSYTQDQYNRLASERLPNGCLTELTYKPGTHLITSKLIKEDHQALKREFHNYDGNGCLIKTIVDNGRGNFADDLSGVSIRKITYISPKTSSPCLGLPEIVEERYFDSITGQECLLGRVVNSYSIEGWLTRQEHYDANNQLSYTLCNVYDNMGNVILEQNALGQITTRRFDDFGNKVFEQGPDTSYYVDYYYDFSNRMIAEERVCNDGGRFRDRYRYDLLGNKIASYDHFGHETIYRYDDLNRLIQTELPACPNRLSTSQEYDIAGNVTCLTDCNGGITRKQYNIRGQPTEIIHPDGSTERLVYNLDGTLAAHTMVNGTTTRFFYDVLDNCTRKETVGSSGELLSTTSAVYKGELLTSETDANGNTTAYEYDGAGRIVAIHKPNTTIRHAYDALGRIAKTEQSIDSDSVRITFFAYDLLDRLLEERVEDDVGTVFTRTLYGYAAAGRRTSITTFNGDTPCTTRTQYNPQGLLSCVTDAEGLETLTHYDFDYCNAQGQRVLRTILVDALGSQTVTIYDVLGRVESITLKDSFNNEIARTASTYDGKGNLIARTDTVKADGHDDREVVTRWTYDALGRVVVLTEASGTALERQTYYTYNRHGQKEIELLPDGVILKYSYDDFGRLSVYESTDETIRYRYRYDSNGNLLRVDDEVNHTTTLRFYDGSNRLISETLANGLTVGYVHDGLDRVTKLTVPDGSTVEWGYDAAFLRSVSRSNYSHQYISYDLGGNLTASKMAGNAGELFFTWDKLARLRSTTSSSFQESIPDGGYDAIGNLLTKTRRDTAGKFTSRYTYDGRYQLTSESGIASHTYLYDSVDNRLLKDTHSCDVNALNQMLNQGDTQYSYDGRGNRIAKSANEETTHYTYDALGRLIEVLNNNARYVYTYDPFNRRLSKTAYTSDHTCTERYLYQEQMEIGAVNSDGTLTQFRALGVGLGAEIAAAVLVELDSKAYAPIHDHSGHVIALVDAETGDTSEYYRYSAFGEEEQSNFINPWRFASKRCDLETKLINFGRRYYDPENGRWLTPDPIGYSDGPNLYAYVHNSPLTHLDLYGLEDLYDRNRSGVSVGRSRSSSAGVARSRMSTGVGSRGGCWSWNDQTPVSSSWGDPGTTRTLSHINMAVDAVRNWDFSTIRHRWNQLDSDGRRELINEFSERATLMLPFAAVEQRLFKGASYVATQTLPAITRLVTKTPLVQQIECVAGRILQQTAQPFQLNRFHQNASQLSEAAQNNIRILRGWAKSKGWQKLPNSQGAPEQWGIYIKGEFEWTLKIKPESCKRAGIHAGSQIPRFDARLIPDQSGQSYINPFTGKVGPGAIGRHLLLDYHY